MVSAFADSCAVRCFLRHIMSASDANADVGIFDWFFKYEDKEVYIHLQHYGCQEGALGFRNWM